MSVEFAVRTTALVNRAAVRRYALEYAGRIGRGHVITAVSRDAYRDLDGLIRRRLRQLVQGHPSGFRTLKP